MGRLDKQVSSAVLTVFFRLAILIALTTIASSLKAEMPAFSILRVAAPSEAGGAHGQQVLEDLVTALILMNNMVPISLYVTLEGVRWWQARAIENDEACVFNGEPIRVRTTNVNEDLGVVDYLLTDKTGTLTQNKLKFNCCIIEDQLQTHVPRRREPSPRVGDEANGEGTITTREATMSPDPNLRAASRRFWRCLALCNTVEPCWLDTGAGIRAGPAQSEVSTVEMLSQDLECFADIEY
jgi:magnesium-transporting ATPase (P-type)